MYNIYFMSNVLFVARINKISQEHIIIDEWSNFYILCMLVTSLFLFIFIHKTSNKKEVFILFAEKHMKFLNQTIKWGQICYTIVKWCVLLVLSVLFFLSCFTSFNWRFIWVETVKRQKLKFHVKFKIKLISFYCYHIFFYLLI